MSDRDPWRVAKVAHERTASLQSIRDKVDDRRTPDSIFAPLAREFDFTIDVAASDDNHRLPRYFTRVDDGLLRSWTNERVWCNPPFSKLEPWIAKAWYEMRATCESVVMLIPANRTEQSFWQTHIEPLRDRGSSVDAVRLSTRFVAGRTHFGYPGEAPSAKRSGPQFGCVLLIWTRVDG